MHAWRSTFISKAAVKSGWQPTVAITTPILLYTKKYFLGRNATGQTHGARRQPAPQFWTECCSALELNTHSPGSCNVKVLMGDNGATP